MTEKLEDSGNQDKKENARVGYQVATTLWTYEGQLVWSKFNAMLVANSIVLAVIGLAISSQHTLPIFTIGMPIGGLIFCAMWFLVTKRGFDNYIYLIRSARELEEQHLTDVVKTVSRGGDFADGKKIELTINGKTKKYRMSWFGRLLRVEWASYIVIAVFAAIYITILIYN
jgi:hypothetical protein